MNLIIDIGNTLTKISVFNNNSEKFFTRCSDANETLPDVFAKYNIKQCIISSVSGTDPSLIKFLNKQTIKTVILTPETALPLEVQYQSPKTLGMDRIALAVGATVMYPAENTLVVDTGTAITYEMITSRGVYVGGNISPGVGIRFNALNQQTANLPLIQAEKTYETIGCNTHEAILYGVMNSVLYEIDGTANAIKTLYNPLKILLTGGDAAYFESKLKNTIFVVRNLTGIGLNRILEYNA